MTGLIQTAPSTYPVTVAEVKRQAVIEHTLDDVYLDRLIAVATGYAEAQTHRQLIDATWKMYLDAFPARIILPRPPLDSVTSIEYIDTGGDTQTLTAVTDYQVSTASEPAWVEPAYGKIWPATRAQREAVIVTYKAGYGTASTDVPQEIRHAIIMLAAHWYENREPIITGTIVAKTPFTVDNLLQHFDVGWQW